MATRLFNFAAVCSAIGFCFIVIAWLAAGAVDPRKQFVSLSRGCHLSLAARSADARLEIFNDSSYGPYCGSIISIAGDPNGPKVSGFGDVAGIYYRLIRWPNGTSLWTLSLSLLYPLLGTAVLPGIWIIRRSCRRHRGIPNDDRSTALFTPD